MSEFVSQFLRNQLGATSIEYALVAAGIALAVVGAVNTLGSYVQQRFFNSIANSFP